MKSILVIVVALVSPLKAAEWQWSVPEGSGRAFLWIPPDCEKVRAVIVGQHNMLEECVLEHPVFRAEMARLGIAEVWVAPNFKDGASIEQGAGERAEIALKSLAAESGYEELDRAPVVPIGHSACATFPWNYAATYPARTLAVLSVHGDAPQTSLTGNGKPRMDWGDRNIDGIPGLYSIGEYEWMDERVIPGLEFRKKFPKSCIAMLAEPGQGHFAAGDELVEFLAMFVRKAAQARLPEVAGGALKAVDPGKGWLLQRWKIREGRSIPPAPVASYQGDPGDAFWAFDAEMATAIQNYQSKVLGKKPQLLGFVQEGKTVPQEDRHEQVKLKFIPEDDGITFSLGTSFLGEVEAGSKNLARWTGLPVGTPIGHATSETEIRRITGPFAVIGKNRFEIRLNRTWNPADKRNNQLWFAARNPGDGDYVPAVQQAMMTFEPNDSGKPQTIVFPEIADVKASVGEIPLAATSDSGMKASYYIREGPAEVEGDVLKLTKIPPHAKFPVKVTVVAWQWGNRQVNTASNVERRIFINP
ncbi:MAG: hypothetical protein ABIS50_06000 [Luteolibacter sp.]|uniref:hypothetical protein n=1 Tax=Luteolibacter sp. TaxID=1962973 RepID=UPI003267FB5A